MIWKSSNSVLLMWRYHSVSGQWIIHAQGKFVSHNILVTTESVKSARSAVWSKYVWAPSSWLLYPSWNRMFCMYEPLLYLQHDVRRKLTWCTVARLFSTDWMLQQT
jgi:hypothetical protein